MAAERIEIPVVIGGREIRTGRRAQAVMPHEPSARRSPTGTRRDAEHVSRPIDAAQRRARRMGELGLGRSRRRVPQGRGAAHDDVARRRSTPRRCSASRRPRFRRRSTRRAS